MGKGGAMKINFTIHRKPLFFYYLLLIILMLVITPAISADEDTLTVEKVTERLELRYPLTLKVTNLPNWLKQAGNDLSKLILHIDGVAVKGLKPSLIENDKLKFDLRRTDENEDAWTTILSRKSDKFFYRFVPVTIGFENGVQVTSKVNLKLIRIKEGRFYVFLMICIVTIILFFGLAWKTDIIRDTGPQPEGDDAKGKPNRKTFSLARTQMAFWFFTIIIGYVFIWMVTSDISSLTPGILGLMGISAVTGLGSAVVDSSKQTEQRNKLRVLKEKNESYDVEVEKFNTEIKTLRSAINAKPAPANLDKQKASLAAKEADLAVKRKEIKQTKHTIKEVDAEVKSAVSEDFFKDILSDDNGISFHRFQIFVWTIVLIIIFLARVYDILAMPTFDATLLALMGISSGTYIGFKLPNQQG